MAPAEDKTHYLENRDSKQFWEIQVSGTETKIRSGKIGYPGRKFPTKKHENPLKARAFARRHVNVKLVHGFEDPAEQQVASIQKKPSFLKKNISIKGTHQRKGPLKKRESVKKLSQQASLKLSRKQTVPAGKLEKTSPIQILGSNPVENFKSKWRKPPKKQSTIRRIAKTVADESKVQIEVSRQDTTEYSTLKVPGSKSALAVSSQKVGDDLVASAKPIWRKPPRKQSTIRRLAKSSSSVNKVKMKNKVQKSMNLSNGNTSSVEVSPSKRPRLEIVSEEVESSVDITKVKVERTSSVQSFITQYMSGFSKDALPKVAQDKGKSDKTFPTININELMGSVKEEPSIMVQKKGKGATSKTKLKSKRSTAKNRGTTKQQKSLNNAISTIVSSEKKAARKEKLSIDSAILTIIGKEAKAAGVTAVETKTKQNLKKKVKNQVGSELKRTTKKQQSMLISHVGLSPPSMESKVINIKKASPKKQTKMDLQDKLLIVSHVSEDAKTVNTKKKASPKKSKKTAPKKKEKNLSRDKSEDDNKIVSPRKSPKQSKKNVKKGTNLTVKLPGVKRALSYSRKRTQMRKVPSKTGTMQKKASVKQTLSKALLKDAILKKTLSENKLKKQTSKKAQKGKKSAKEVSKAGDQLLQIKSSTKQFASSSNEKPTVHKKSSIKSLKGEKTVKKDKSALKKKTSIKEKEPSKSTVKRKKSLTTSSFDAESLLSKNMSSVSEKTKLKPSPEKKELAMAKSLSVSKPTMKKTISLVKKTTAVKAKKLRKKYDTEIPEISPVVKEVKILQRKASSSSVGPKKVRSKSLLNRTVAQHKKKKLGEGTVLDGVGNVSTDVKKTQNTHGHGKTLAKVKVGQQGQKKSVKTSSEKAKSKSSLKKTTAGSKIITFTKVKTTDSDQSAKVSSKKVTSPLKGSPTKTKVENLIKINTLNSRSKASDKTAGVKPPLMKTTTKRKSVSEIEASDSSRKNVGYHLSPSKISKKPKLVLQPTLPVADLSNVTFQSVISKSRQVSREFSLSKQETLQLPPGEQTSHLGKQGVQSLTRLPSLTVGPDDVYIPSKKDWPLCMRAPVSWRLLQKGADPSTSNTYAVYVENSKCVFGDDSGRVYELDELGHVQRGHNLNVEVKVITKEDGALYVGCSNGVVYEISTGFPELIYQPPKEESEFSEVQGLALFGGVLAISNVCGHVIAVNHDGNLLWKKMSSGEGGWLGFNPMMFALQLCVDESGVYHGHSDGVTKYSLFRGQVMWNNTWSCDIFAGAQSDYFVYVADYTKVHKLNKASGHLELTYEEEVNTCGCILSLAVGRGLVIAGGLNIICYDELSTLPIYKFSLQDFNNFKPLGLQYHSGRLYCVGEGGLHVIELSREAVMKVKSGQKKKPRDLALRHPSMGPPSLTRKPTSVKKKVASEVQLCCVQEGGTLRVKPVTQSFKKTWSCEFPLYLKEAGANYIVSGLTPNGTGKFYRVEGEIKLLDK